MLALNILLADWPLVLALVVTFVAGLVVAMLLFVLDKERALHVVAAPNMRRQSLIKMMHRLLLQPRGIMKAMAFIFAVNLFGGQPFSAYDGRHVDRPTIYLLVHRRLAGRFARAKVS